MVSRVKPCVIAPSQRHNMLKGKHFRYHIRAMTRTGSLLYTPLCNKEFIPLPISYTELHNASGIGSLCAYCRKRESLL